MRLCVSSRDITTMIGASCLPLRRSIAISLTAGFQSLTDVRSGRDPVIAHKKVTYNEATVCHIVFYSTIHRAGQEDREKKADVIQPGGRWSWTDTDRDLQHPESDI